MKKIQITNVNSNMLGKAFSQFSTNLLLKQIILITIATICFVGINSCSDKNVNNTKDGNTLQEEKENLLLGTKWKLFGYFDVEKNELKQDGYENYENYENTFILFFDTDSTISGTATNKLTYGKYLINFQTSTLNFIDFTMDWSDWVEDSPAGHSYVAIMNTIQHFSFTEELKLFYNDKKKYLLFKRRY